MRCYRALLVLPLLALLPTVASAGIFFGKKATKPDPVTRVPELIATVKSDGDESKRAAAAEELRQYDPATQPDIVPILVDVLMHDPKPAVRAEAAQSLAKLRPVSQQAGWALEQAAAKDASMRVRFQARSSLLMYHMAGYHSPKVEEPPANGGQTKEPPLADPVPPPVQTVPATVKPAPAAAPGGRLVPTAQPPLVPTAAPKLEKPPAPVDDQGPALGPPR